MDRSDVCTLVSRTYQADEYGVLQPKEETTDVFCSVSSVSGEEFFEGGRNGLRPELRITLFGGDYMSQGIVEYKGTRFTVYRVYLGKNDTVELYLERRTGNESN